MKRYKYESGPETDKTVLESYITWTQAKKNRPSMKEEAGMRYWSAKGDSQPATPASAKN